MEELHWGDEVIMGIFFVPIPLLWIIIADMVAVVGMLSCDIIYL